MANDPNREPAKLCCCNLNKAKLRKHPKPDGIDEIHKSNVKQALKTSKAGNTQDLENRYLAMCEEAIELKKLCSAKEEKIKRLATKLFQVVNERNVTLRCVNEHHDRTCQRDELLERNNQVLQDRVFLLKNQLKEHIRLHDLAHCPSSTDPKRPASNRSKSTIKKKPQNNGNSECVGQCSPSPIVEPSVEAQLRHRLTAMEQTLAMLREQATSRIAQLETELAANQASERRSQTAENMELIRLKREVRQHSTQNEALAVKAEAAEKDVFAARSAVDELLVQNGATHDSAQPTDLASQLQKCREHFRVQLTLFNRTQKEVEKLTKRVRELEAEALKLKGGFAPSNGNSSYICVENGEGMFEIHMIAVQLTPEGKDIIPENQKIFLSWMFFEQSLAQTVLKPGNNAEFNSSVVYKVNIDHPFFAYIKNEDCTIHLHVTQPNGFGNAAQGTVCFSELLQFPQNKLHATVILKCPDPVHPQKDITVGQLRCWYRLSCDVRRFNEHLIKAGWVDAPLEKPSTSTGRTDPRPEILGTQGKAIASTSTGRTDPRPEILGTQDGRGMLEIQLPKDQSKNSKMISPEPNKAVNTVVAEKQKSAPPTQEPPREINLSWAKGKGFREGVRLSVGELPAPQICFAPALTKVPWMETKTNVTDDEIQNTAKVRVHTKPAIYQLIESDTSLPSSHEARIIARVESLSDMENDIAQGKMLLGYNQSTISNRTELEMMEVLDEANWTTHVQKSSALTESPSVFANRLADPPMEARPRLLSSYEVGDKTNKLLKKLSSYDVIKHKNTITIHIHSLYLEPESSAMRNSNITQVYVEYRFLGQSGPKLETTSLHLESGKRLDFNYKYRFNYDEPGQKAVLLGMLNTLSWHNEIIQFIVINEPLDESGKYIDCEEVGYVDVNVKQLVLSEQDMVKADLPVYSSDGYKDYVGVLCASITGISKCKNYLGNAIVMTE